MTDPARILRIAADVRICAESWERSACLLGNVTAAEVIDLAVAATEYAAQAYKLMAQRDGMSFLVKCLLSGAETY